MDVLYITFFKLGKCDLTILTFRKIISNTKYGI